MKTWFANVLLAFVLVCVAPAARADFPGMGDLMFANGWDRPTVHAGGANYLWYFLGAGCNREPYGLIPNYGAPGVRATAQQQLQAMHAQGMRSLSIGLSFRNDPFTGTVIDATDPAAVAAAAFNLDLLLQDIDAAGFQRVLFRFFPEGHMSPTGAINGSFDPSTLDLYWNAIETMRVPLANGPLDYLIDLGVEGAPPDDDKYCTFPPKHKWQCPAYEDWSNAVRELWRRYRNQYGTADTVGFSFITTVSTSRRRVRHMKYVYDGLYPGDWPDVLAVDIYGDATHGNGAYRDADVLINMINLIHDYAADYGVSFDGLIISEAWNNDPLAAAGLSSAIAATGQKVLYLTEWPLDRAASCSAVSESPPYLFDIYGMYGF